MAVMMDVITDVVVSLLRSHALLWDDNVAIVVARIEGDVPLAVTLPAALVARSPDSERPHEYAARLLTDWLQLNVGRQIRTCDIAGTEPTQGYLLPREGGHTGAPEPQHRRLW